MGLFDFFKKNKKETKANQTVTEGMANNEENTIKYTVHPTGEAKTDEAINAENPQVDTEVKKEQETVQNPTPQLTPEEYGRLAIERLTEETKTKFLRYKLVDNKPVICESKIGGIPYLPVNEEVPCDKSGRQMRLLAQIDCEQLTELEDYPYKGMLQFWLTTNPMWDEFGGSVMWGDLGVGSFFIKRKDLKAGNMDDVYFSWDCS